MLISSQTLERVQTLFGSKEHPYQRTLGAGIIEVSLSGIPVANLEMCGYVWKVQWDFIYTKDGRALWERTFPKGERGLRIMG